MRPVPFAVLAVAAVLTAPALGAAAAGDLPLDVALTRYLLAAGLSWVLLSVAWEWLWPEGGAATASDVEPASPEAASDDAAASTTDAA